MSITKAHLADSIHNQLGLPKIQSVQALESIIEIIKNALENGEDVLITGFGKFYVKEKSKRRGRNPATGEDLMLGSCERKKETEREEPCDRGRFDVGIEEGGWV
jgi:integration host factor subunit alpha